MLSDEELMDAFPGVRVDHDNAAHYRGLAERRLLINRCDDCGTFHHPPRSVCPRCWSRAVTATDVSGRGTIAMLTFHTPRPRRATGDGEGPYPVVAIELAEQPGLRVAATIIGAAKEDIVLDAPVELAWVEREGRPVPAFRLARLGTRKDVTT
jgi:uncharacterized OB-fold protein